ncbi:MAG: tRNA 2-thiouridine(34) synthase MnmA [Spirochaetia bacterium]|nr:tRNA 2-thiouridine(34) synthase MnmA [Spirochaetia bacterium]MDD7698281.1 tRNA 2-thiouridine(34) synthase MnmA [Spirochaetia bacterium]
MKYIEAKMPEKNDTVVVGMSGGVDSTLTALLLKQKGCNVIGATMSLWDGSIPEGMTKESLPPSCFGPNEEKNIAECEVFCKNNGIEYHVINVTEEYKKNVLEYFKSEYRAGRTPNPCIRCNQTVKFGAFLEGIKKAGIDFDYFCTGHYAKIVISKDGVFGTNKRPYMLANALDSTKDQTYFLYRLSSETLSKIRFPLASLTKAEVFELAKKSNLAAAARKESQDFIAEEYFDMLFSDKKSIPGDIIDLDGNILGRHRGIEHYTIGQRRGLGVAVNYPVYVKSIDAEKNIIVLAPNDALNSQALIADDFVWPADIPPDRPVNAMVKIRLASRPSPALIERYEAPESEQETYKSQPYKITFEMPQRAATPGQSVVLYKDNVIIGGGIIRKIL